MGESNIQSTYTWTPGSDKMIRVSKSTLDTYSNWCGQQLWLSKVCPVEEQEHDYLIIGNNVHQRHEDYYNNLKANASRNNGAVVAAIKHAKVGNDKKAFEILKSFYPEAEGEYAEREQAQQDWLVRHDVLRLKHCDTPEDFLPVANELDLDAIVDVDVPGHGVVKIHLRGIIDRIFKTDDGVVLMELKTGKWRPQYDVPKIKGEMAYYAYLLNESDSDLGPVTHWGWRYPGADHWDFQEAKKVSITAAKKRLGRLVKSYLEEDFPVVSQRHEYKCGHCDFMAFCPKWTPYENPIEVANGAEPIWKEGKA
jgi:CRISPR/Cas system-associated exonuclease Cas4 (RecB family)